MSHVRNNRTQKCKLMHEHKQIDRMIAQKLKEQRIAVFKLNKELAQRSKPPTPTVDNFLSKHSKRHVQFQVKDQERHTKIYEDLCKANLKQFRQLQLPKANEVPMSLLEVLIDKEKIARERKRLHDLEIQVEIERERKAREDDEDGGDVGYDEDGTDEETSDNEEIISTKEDKESNAMYHGRRRFTMNAYGALPQFGRISNGAISDLAAILQVQESNADKANDNAIDYDYNEIEIGSNKEVIGLRNVLGVLAESEEEETL